MVACVVPIFFPALLHCSSKGRETEEFSLVYFWLKMHFLTNTMWNQLLCCAYREIWNLTISAATKTKMDVHSRLMQKYKQVPEWWFQVILIGTIVLSVFACEYYKDQLQLPWWGVLLACAVALVFTLPIGVISATTNQVLSWVPTWGTFCYQLHHKTFPLCFMPCFSNYFLNVFQAFQIRLFSNACHSIHCVMLFLYRPIHAFVSLFSSY